MSLQAMWQGMTDVAGSRDQAMMGLKKAFGQYNYAEDPAYQRDMLQLQQNPTTQQLGAFYEKWGDNIPAENIQELTKGLSYAEGTPQWTEQQIRENQLAQSNIKTEYMPEFTDIELGLAKNNLAQSNVQTEYAPRFAEQQFQQGEQSLTQGQQQIDANAIRNKYLEPQLRQQMTAGEIANDINQLELEFKRESDPIRLQLLQNDLQLANETLADKIALSGLQVDNSEAQLRTNQSQARVMEGTEAARTNAPYIQNESGRLTNDTRRTNNRILDATAGNQITQSDLETKLMELQLEQAQNPQVGEGGEGTQSLADHINKVYDGNWGYQGMSQNGYPVFKSSKGGSLEINPETMETRDYTNKPVQNTRVEDVAFQDPDSGRNVTFDGQYFKYADDGSYYAKELPEGINIPYIEEQFLSGQLAPQNLSTTQTEDKDFDETEESGGWEESISNLWNGLFGNDEEIQTQQNNQPQSNNVNTGEVVSQLLTMAQQNGMSQSELEDFIRNNPEAVEQDTGVSASQILGRLQMQNRM